MTSRFLRSAALAVALVALAQTHAADDGIGVVTGTSTPQVIVPPGAGAPQTPAFAPPSAATVAPEVIVPPTTAAPQTPAYPPPPIGATAPGIIGLPPLGNARLGAPRPAAPARPPG
jgi:hypothetical protein